jgi:branched-chain amino acid transport system permease protein
MAFFLQIAFAGLALGCIYALIGLGFSIIFKASQVINFAQGEFLLVGAFIASLCFILPSGNILATAILLQAALLVVFLFARSRIKNLPRWLQTDIGYAVALALSITIATIVARLLSSAGMLHQRASFLLAVLVAVILTVETGVSFERLALRRMIGKPIFAILMVTIGLDILLLTGVVISQNRLIKSNIQPSATPFNNNSGLNLGDVHLGAIELTTILVTILLCAGLYVFFRFTRYGLAMRATALDQEAALAIGINIRTVYALAWGIAGAIATMGGVFLAAESAAFDVTLGTTALLAFPAIILGGLDSVSGAVIGGILIGLAEDLTAGYENKWALFLNTHGYSGLAAYLPNIHEIAPYLIMLLILFIRPYGLFGTRKVERV